MNTINNYNNGIFTVNPNGNVIIDYLYDGGWYGGELAIFSLAGMEDLEVGSTEFISEAANRALTNSEAGHVVLNDKTDLARFNNLNGGTAYKGAQSFQMGAGERFAMMLVVNGIVADLAANRYVQDVFFSFATAENSNGQTFGQIADLTGYGHTFGWEDIDINDLEKVDNDYNDIVIQVQGATTTAIKLEDSLNSTLDWLDAKAGQKLLEYANRPVEEVGTFTVNYTGQFTFEYLFDGGWWQGELGIYNLSGMDAYTPGSVEYIQEAVRRAVTNSNDGYILMSDGTEGARYSTTLPWERDYNQGEYLGVKTFSMNAGDRFGLVMTQNTALATLADNPESYTQPGKLPLFSIAEANPDGNAPQQFAALDGYGTFGFEAVRVDGAGSDRDYNEVVFQLIGATGNAPYYGKVRNPGRNFRMSTIGEQIRSHSQQNVLDDGYLVVGKSSEVTIDVLFDGGWYKGEVGIFNLEGMERFEAGSLEFIQEAATRALTNSNQGYVLLQDQIEGARFDGNFPWERNFNDGVYQGQKTLQLTAGGRYGLMLVPNTTLVETATNPSLDGVNGKRPFFSMKGGNLINSVQMLEHPTVRDDLTIIGMEDLNIYFGGDRDYNDVMLAIEGATLYAPDYEDEKDSQYEIDYAPIANGEYDLTYKDTAIAFSLSDLLDNDYDFDGDAINFNSFDVSNTLGLVSRINDRLIYDPNGQFDGLKTGETAVDRFSYTITDSTGNTDTATVDITIKGFDDNSNENNVGTLDSVHLLPPLYAKQDVRDHYLVLSTDEETAFTVTIQNADGAEGIEGGVSETITVSKSAPAIIDLSSAPFGTGQGHASLGVIDGEQVGKIDRSEGLILTGDKAFYANVRHQTNLQGLSLSSKGQLALGTEFRSGHLVTNTSEAWRKSHFISVMASEDNTVVSFKDLPAGVEFVNGHPGEVTLDKYESFVVGMNIGVNKSLPNSLQGSLIVADKPVAVNSGSWLSGTVGGGRDIGVDQIVPTNLIGSKYILVKGEATSNANLLERPIVIATEDNTEVYLRGETTPFATLNAGEDLILDGDEYPISDALLIETSKPAYVYQMTSANNMTAPGLSLVLPVAKNAGNQEILIPSIDSAGPGKLNIVARNTATVEVDNSIITGGVAVEGDSEFLVYQVEGLSGDVTVTADESIIVTSTTGGGHIGAASYWSGLPTTLAFDDVVSTTADTPITIDVLSNDLIGTSFQPVGLPQAPSNGTAIINEDDTITYTPDAGFSGTDVFVYRGINDGGKTDTAIVTVSVNQNLVEGSVGNDTLTGSAVSDRIVGYAGNDTITTGDGNDVLVFNTAGEGVDTVTDFTVGSDRIDMTGMLGAVDPLNISPIDVTGVLGAVDSLNNDGISFTQSGNDAVMQYDNSDLAIFLNVSATAMNDAENFVF